MPKLKCRIVNTVIDRKIEPKSLRFRKIMTRVGAQPAVMTKSKEENAILANEKLKHVMNKIGIGVEIDEVQTVDKLTRNVVHQETKSSTGESAFIQKTEVNGAGKDCTRRS